MREANDAISPLVAHSASSRWNTSLILWFVPDSERMVKTANWLLCIWRRNVWRHVYSSLEITYTTGNCKCNDLMDCALWSLFFTCRFMYFHSHVQWVNSYIDSWRDCFFPEMTKIESILSLQGQKELAFLEWTAWERFLSSAIMHKNGFSWQGMVKFGQYLKHNIVPEWRDKVIQAFRVDG